MAKRMYWTKERKEILRAILEAKQPLTAVQINHKLVERRNLTSICRLTKALVTSGLLLRSSDRPALYRIHPDQLELVEKNCNES